MAALKKDWKLFFQYQSSLNAGQKYCRMLHGEHSAILSTFIMLPFVIKIFVLSIFEWPFYTGFTVTYYLGLLLVLHVTCNLSSKHYGTTPQIMVQAMKNLLNVICEHQRHNKACASNTVW